MLTDEEVRSALHAARVVPLRIENPHGPFGLEQVASALEKIRVQEEDALSRPVSLRTETWQKLDAVAKKAATASKRHVSASDVASALLEQVVTRGIE